MDTDSRDIPDPTLRPWHGHYDPGVGASLQYPAIPLDALLAGAAERFPGRPALVFFGRRTTYRALDDAVSRLATGLRGLGLQAGDRVALLMPNCPQLVATFYAVWRAGCVAVPVNPRAVGPELSRELADAGVAAAIALDRLWVGLEDVTVPASMRHLIVADAADDLPFWMRIAARLDPTTRRIPRISGSSAPPAVVSLKSLLRPSPVSSPGLAPRQDDPAVLLYTGGTTGLPKAAVLTHRNLVANACQLGAWASTLHEGAEVMLSALPLVHGYAMTGAMNVSVLRGWTQVLVPDARNTRQLLAEIERCHVTAMPGVPALYAAICAEPDVAAGRRDLRSIEACISGAAALPSGLQAEFQRLTGGRLVEGYGLTEASPATHCHPFGELHQGQGIGLPLPDTDCRLVDIETETRIVGPGEQGVLCIRGPQVMAGYWQRPGDTERALRRDADGLVWLHTGDVAEMTADGFYRIVDRKKEVIVAAGGLKVYPNEIEEVLSTHPKVHQAAVIGIPVGGADQRAKAFVVLRRGERTEPAEVLEFLRARLAPYKVPKAVEFRAELPLSFTGKVLRRVLAAEEAAAAAI